MDARGPRDGGDIGVEGTVAQADQEVRRLLGDAALGGHHSICERNSRVRGSLGSLKKVSGGPCSTMTPRSVK